jgi:HK97 family phage major capsid protein
MITMTMPADPVTTASFRSVLHPPQVTAILNMLVGGSPMASALRRYPTDRSAVAFPTAKPDRPGWIPEMGEIPIIGLNDDADIVAVKKLSEILPVSNESIDDSSVNLTQQLGELLRDSCSVELDRGILYGSEDDEPRGIVASALPAAGADLAEALSNAIGSVGDAGGIVSHLAARPSVLATARNLRNTSGDMLYPLGFGAAMGVQEVGVPELAAADILAFDATRCWLIVRNDFDVAISQDYFFNRDAAAVRIRGRFAVGVPVIEKSLRRLEVTAVVPPGADEPGADEPGAGRPPLVPRSHRARK